MGIKMAGIELEEFNGTCVNGSHVYNNVWRPVIGEELRFQRKEDILRDPYTVAVTKLCTRIIGVKVLGHIPHYLSTFCLLFIRQSGAVYCIVTGTQPADTQEICHKVA